MNDGGAGRVHDLIRDQLPDLAAGTLSPEETARLKARLAADPDLRAEYKLIQALREDRPEPPPGFGDRIREQMLAKGPTRRRSLWPLSTAAVLVLALGTAVLWGRGGGEDLELPSLEASVSPVFPTDDGLVAGALVLGDLTEAELQALLEELGG